MKLILDDGFSFGKGAFETIKIIDGQVMNIDRHLERLNTSLEFLEINKVIKKEEVLEKGKNFNQAFKIIVSDKNTLFIDRKDPYINLDRNYGIKVEISDYIRNSTAPLTYHKSLAYYDNLLKLREIRSQSAFEGLLINEKEQLTEGFISNFFFTKNDKIYTPKVSCGLLNGTMRQWLMDEFDIIEGVFKKDDLKEMEGVFITNSLIGIHWVDTIGDLIFQKTKEIKEMIDFLEEKGY